MRKKVRSFDDFVDADIVISQPDEMIEKGKVLAMIGELLEVSDRGEFKDAVSAFRIE
jgi:hypothetical protein